MKEVPDIIKILQNEEKENNKKNSNIENNKDHLLTDSQILISKEDEIKKSIEKAIASSINAIIITDIDGNISYVNNSFLQMWGYNSKDEVLWQPLVRFWKTKGKYVEIMDTLIEKGGWIGELTAERKNGTHFTVQLSASTVHDNQGKPTSITASFVDISEKKHSEKKLKKSEEKFRDIFEATSDLLFYLDTKGHIIDINKTALNMLQINKKNAIGTPLYKIRGLSLPKEIKEFLKTEKIDTKQKIKDYESDLETQEGQKYRFLFFTDYIIHEGKIKGILFKGRDVTQRQKAWEEMVKSEEKYRVLAETSADGVFTTDELGRLTYVNPSLVKIFGRRKGQILATLFRNYLSEGSIYLFQQVFLEVRQRNEKKENVELEIIHGEGYEIPIEVNIAPLKKDENFAGIECTVRDIAERKKIEQELKKSELLKTEFMNIAAHELKSPVTPIKGYLDLIISDDESTEKIKGWAKISLRNSERLLSLVNDILDVSRLDSDTMRFNMEKFNTKRMLKDIIEDMEIHIKKNNLEFKTEIPENLPNIVGDKNRLSQVLKNLLTNAVKCTENGSITLRARTEKKHLYIEVEDTGIGISEEHREKIFHKFYQAYTGDDRRREGVGLGLFICKEIIKKYKGDISVQSTVGMGTIFSVKLPQ